MKTANEDTDGQLRPPEAHISLLGGADKQLSTPASCKHDDEPAWNHLKPSRRLLVALCILFALTCTALLAGTRPERFRCLASLIGPTEGAQWEAQAGQQSTAASGVHENPQANQNNESFSGNKVEDADNKQLVRSRRRVSSSSSSGPSTTSTGLSDSMRFVLMCQVLDGEPPIHIKWFRDGRELSGGQPTASIATGATTATAATAMTTLTSDEQTTNEVELMSSDELGSSLVFRRVKAHHSGNYTCLASNHFGSTSFSSHMSVKVPPSWRIEPHDQQSIMGEQITIDCQASGNPNPFIRWKFASGQSFHHHQRQTDGANQSPDPMTSPFIDEELTSGTNNGPQLLASNLKLINSNHHVQTLENGSLSIRQTSKEQHEGLYMCEADNGVEPSLIKLIRLQVHQQAHFLHDIRVTLQDNTTTSIGGAHRLATNQATSTTTTSSSSGTPIPVRSVRLPQNSSLVRLTCEPLGDLPLQLDWLKEGRLIHSHSTGGSAPAAPTGQSSVNEPGGASLADLAGRYYVNTKWGSSSAGAKQHLESELTLIQLARQDAGLFTCVARNAFGQAERRLRLVVQEVPEPPGPVDVAHISSRSISLRWLAPFDGHSAILKYVVEFRKLASTSVSGSASASDQPHFGPETPDTPIGRSEKLMPASAVATFGPDVQLPLLDSGMEQAGQVNQISHTIHELEPLASYSIRVVAVNALGASRPSVALSLRTEEEVPATVPNLVEAQVLSSRSIKLHWTVSFSPDHELIDGFFVGYRSFDTSSLLVEPQHPTGASLAPPGVSLTPAKQALERPTYTYKTIRLTNAPPDGHSQSTSTHGEPAIDGQAATPLLSPVSSVTKTVQTNSGAGQRQQVVVVSSFEYIIGGLERNTEYTILIQCFNKKGAGPTSDPVVFKTFTSDPPEKVSLVAEEISESSIKLSWHFPSETATPMLVSGNGLPDSHQQAVNGRHFQDQIDGFVLTFSRVSSRFKLASPTSKSLPDSAARISLQAPPTSPNGPPATAANHHQLIQADHQWQAVQLAPQQRKHLLKNLECGTWYAMKIWAFNKVGKGEPSELVTVSTRGKAPVAPDRRSFLGVNITQARLHLAAWYDGGCDIEKFIVQYRARGQQEWILVSNNILREQNSVLIRDLSPATTYELLVGAQNQVGLTEARYRLTTLDVDGKQVALSHSFFGSSSFLANDGEDNITVDYTDDTGTRREVWPNGHSSSSSLPSSSFSSHPSGRWILITRQILNSPVTLLLALSLFLILLILLIFHRLNDSAHESGSSTGTLASSSHKSNSQTSGGAGDTQTSSGCGLGLDVGAPGDSPAALTDVSPSHVNLSGVRLASQNPLDTNNPTSSDFYGNSSNNNNNSPYCSQATECNSAPGYFNCNSAGAQNYYAMPGAGAYASVHRSSTMEPRQVSLQPVVEQQDERQQYLMQMLMTSPQQQQQHLNLNHHQQQMHTTADLSPTSSSAAYSVAAALTTMARQKSGAFKTPAMGQHCQLGYPMSGNLTLGRQVVAGELARNHQPPQ